MKNEYFPLQSVTRQGCLFSPLLFNCVLEANAIGQEKEITLETNKYAFDMTLYLVTSGLTKLTYEYFFVYFLVLST